MKKDLKKNTIANEENFSFLVESLEDYGVLMLDKKGKIISWNKGAKKIFGYSQKEVIGKSVSLIFSKNDIKLKMPALEMKTAILHGRADDERQHKRKDGSLFWATGVMWAIKDKKGDIQGLSKLIRDISDRKAMEDKIRHQSLHDTLTGLPNRRSFEDRFTLAIKKAKENDEVLATVFLDLDNFKKVNDTLGHDTGDILLQDVASRLSHVLRKGDSICRLGGDEFIIIINNLKTKKNINPVLRKLQKALKPNFSISNKKISMAVSMGVAFYPLDGKTPKKLEKKADLALYKAKKSGKNKYSFF